MMSSSSAPIFGTFFGAAVDALAYALIGWVIIRVFYAITKRRYLSLSYIVVSILSGILSLIIASALNPNADGSTVAASILGRLLVVLLLITIALIIGATRKKKDAVPKVDDT